MTAYIYSLSHPVSGFVRYVGKTCDLRKRMIVHLSTRKPRGCNTYLKAWIRSLQREGLRPVMDVLEEIPNSNDEDWQEVEQFYITYLRLLGCRLCNLDSGGIGGRRLALETRAKMSRSRIGKTANPEAIEKTRAAHIGMKRSRETKARISASRIGRKASAETKKKLSAAHKGRVVSEETREKLRAVLKGRKFSPETKARMSASLRRRWERGGFPLDVRLKMNRGRKKKSASQLELAF